MAVRKSTSSPKVPKRKAAVSKNQRRRSHKRISGKKKLPKRKLSEKAKRRKRAAIKRKSVPSRKASKKSKHPKRKPSGKRKPSKAKAKSKKPASKKPSSKKKPSKKKQKAKKHKLTNYNRFQKALSRFLRDNNIEYHKHGSFSFICGTLWQSVKNEPINVVLAHIEDIYYSHFAEPEANRDEDLKQIREDFATSEWFKFRDELYSSLITSEFIKPGDIIYFIGEPGVINTYDLSGDSDNVYQLHDDMKVLFADRKSPYPSVSLYKSQTDGIKIVLFYHLEFTKDELGHYRGRLGEVNADEPDIKKLLATAGGIEKGEEAPEAEAPTPEQPGTPTTPSKEKPEGKSAKERELEKEIELEKEKQKTMKEKVKSVKELKKAGMSMKDIMKFLGL